LINQISKTIADNT